LSGTDYHPPLKRSVEIAGHKTSLSLEPMFWDLLKAAAVERGLPVNALVAQIDAERIEARAATGLAGAVRLWLIARLCERQNDAARSTCTERGDGPPTQAEQQ
jgi:predicted DNA-binding ribbon-helix-helix protein